MKHIYTILFCILAVSAAFAQKTRVSAATIIKQINDGRPVEYTNAEIEGDLDLTDLNNRRLEHSNRFSDHETWESEVEVALNFTNCTFLGDVVAYYHLETRHETYVAHFEKEVTFKNCNFRKAAEFKYSEFNGNASFEGSAFNYEANFKYAEFSEGPSFANVKFESGVDFKYTEFPHQTSFEKATFEGLANFKYARFRSPLNMKGTSFEGSEDFKYTTIDGRNFTSYLLRN